MPNHISMDNSSKRKAYVVTGPTSARVVAETRALLGTVPNEMGEGSTILGLVEQGKRS